MITKAFLVLVHQYPDQLCRLIEKLDGPDTVFYIHVDLKSNMDDFKTIVKENVVFIEHRVDCIWADFSQIRATLHLITEVFHANYSPALRVTLMSGQDYPIKSTGFISDFLARYPHVNFLNMENISDSGIRHLKNIRAFKINHSSRRADFTLVSRYHWKSAIKGIVLGKIHFSAVKLLFKKKEIPLNMTPYRGSQWFSFHIDTLKKIINFYHKNKKTMDSFFSDVLCPDEFFFHTIVMHLKAEDPDIHIMPSLTYDNWTRKGADLPITFQLSDLEELLSQPDNKLFARKFNTKIDAAICDELDRQFIQWTETEQHKINGG
ncbi:hypothetical protein BWD42_07335 [Sphingobacterium sp. CZ-UAM]|uniref:beta-1,6-N-acetylglucosaminyltransferase n=1 Tax=Sphingobacterium sp. CZ-UAM TaxID=1933868 RepID=UPI0009858C95|nr:beta-1,6-N-acetylglucosaminyltransferase [Sphingobacterium sp. CZ-UAM]OOG19708.1 hypothetical protein BWD42_07335 [Sphingobacterium sp. CZ-UAM]